MILDLTHILEEGVIVYPGTPSPSFKACNTLKKDGFSELLISMTTHTGTHIDAPAHILKGKKTLDKFSLDKFVGPGMVIDCRGLNEINLEFLIKLEDQIRNSEFILFYAGWQVKWNTKNYFDSYPTLTKQAAQYLSTFSIKAVGFDVISVDPMDSEHLPNHHILLIKEILIIENLTNLDLLISKTFEMNCIPIKILDSDGSPVRAFARIQE